MTAEERAAYFHKEKNLLNNTKKYSHRKVGPAKWELFFSIIIFILFLSLDFTGYEINGYGSHDICRIIMKNSETLISFFESGCKYLQILL